MAESSTPGGYIEDAAYPTTYFRELSPAWLNYALTINGAPAQPLQRRFRYLELGCGQGLSAIVHAASFPEAEFHACDVDKQCIESARRLAAELGVDNLELHRASFAELEGIGLEPFDFVVAHGVYSWIDGPARLSLRRLIGALLAGAGVASVSYNCMPGWTTEGPLRRMLVELAATLDGDAAGRAHAAARTLQTLAAGSSYFRLHPEAGAAVESYLRSPGGYLAHEFLNPAFVPFYSVDVADEMAEVGLTGVGSATLVDNHPELLVESSAAAAIAALPNARQRQLALDFAVHRRFRRDLFMRAEALAGGAAEPEPLVVGCLGDPDAIATTIRVPRGRIAFDDGFVHALRRRMINGSSSLAELIEALSRNAADRAHVTRNLLYLIAAGELAPFARRVPVAIAEAPPRLASEIHRRWLRHAAGSEGPWWIPSPVSGTGIAVDGAAAAAVLEQVGGGADGANAPAAEPPAGLLTRLRRLGILR